MGEKWLKLNLHNFSFDGNLFGIFPNSRSRNSPITEVPYVHLVYLMNLITTSFSYLPNGCCKCVLLCVNSIKHNKDPVLLSLTLSNIELFSQLVKFGEIWIRYPYIYLKNLYENGVHNMLNPDRKWVAVFDVAFTQHGFSYRNMARQGYTQWNSICDDSSPSNILAYTTRLYEPSLGWCQKCVIRALIFLWNIYNVNEEESFNI